MDDVDRDLEDRLRLGKVGCSRRTACGAGLYWAAVAVAQLVVVAGLAPVEEAFAHHAKHAGRLQIRYTSSAALAAVIAKFTDEGYTVTEMQGENGDGDDRVTDFVLSDRSPVGELTVKLRTIEDIENVRYHEEDSDIP